MATAGASSGRQEANVARAWRCNLSIPPLLAHRERCRWMDVLAKWDETGRALHDFLWLISGNSDCIVGPSISWEVDPNNLSPITDVSFDNASGLFTVTTLFLSIISITMFTFYYCNIIWNNNVSSKLYPSVQIMKLTWLSQTVTRFLLTSHFSTIIIS